MNDLYGIFTFHDVLSMKMYKFYPLEFEFYLFLLPHNKGDKNRPFAQLPPPHKMQIESSGWT